MDLTRRSGVLLHPSSLPGPYGRGDLGREAHAFVDRLADAGQTVWQLLPVGPPGYGGSPYAGFSAFAGDTALIDLDRLRADGLLEAADLADAPAARDDACVDEGGEAFRRERLRRAARRFVADADAEARAALAAFRAAQSYWLEDYALFTALKAAHGGGAYWGCWPEALARHLPAPARAARAEHRAAIEEEVALQFLFAGHWDRLREHARSRGVLLLGDVPIFLARDSADVWSRPELFDLRADGSPRVVAGVPPDGFSEDGQLWGNPLYDWPIHARTGYGWWIERVRHELARCDLVRIDHFRGFAGYWEVPADAPTAREGQWVPGPGAELFDAIAAALGAASPRELAIVAEDLGVVTDDVTELLEATGFPGMRVLQFAYYDDDDAHPFRPENQPAECVVYTGTHDNETTAGWFASLDDATRARVVERIGEAGAQDPAWSLIDLALGAPAFLAVVPAQDLLGLDNTARMNSPGLSDGNWSWRLRPGQLTAAVWERLRALSAVHGRTPSA